MRRFDAYLVHCCARLSRCVMARAFTAGMHWLLTFRSPLLQP
jgi:hypothetical protein